MIWPPKGPKLAGRTAGPSMFVICCAFVVSARCVTFGGPKKGGTPKLLIVKMRPFSQVMIILLRNVPTLSNVIAEWSELGQPPSTPAQVANSVKIPLGGVALKTAWLSVTKRSPGVNPAPVDSAGARARYFSVNMGGMGAGSVPKGMPIPKQSTILIWLSLYWLTYRLDPPGKKLGAAAMPMGCTTPLPGLTKILGVEA
jgi:hypothetical protein